MKKHNIYVLTIMLLFALGACSKDYFDVNTDPNNPTQVTPEFVLPSGTLSAGVVVGGYYNLLGGFWSQYWTQSAGSNQYKYIDSYQLLNSDFHAQWYEMYTGALNNLNYVKQASVNNKNWSYYFMATVVESYSYQVLADLYDQIPFNEALKGTSGNTQPHYNTAETVYDSITNRLEKLFTLDLNTPLSANQIKQDLIYGSSSSYELEMDNWKAFANTLLLKIYLRQMYVRPDVAQAGIKALYSRGAKFLDADAKLDIFIDQPNKDNPLFELDRRTLNTAYNIRASATLYKYLANLNDTRLNKIYAPGADGKTTFIPMVQGAVSDPAFNTAAILANTGTAKILPIDPIYFISKAESYFLQAEAVAKGWAAGDDNDLYSKGVLAAFDKYGLDGTSFLTLPEYEYPTSGGFEDKQKAIIMQKWVSMAGSEGIESFFETNRTHYPIISANKYVIGGTNTFYAGWKGGEFLYSLIGGTGGNFPKRLLFPDTERTGNANTPAEVPLTAKVWWDKK